MSASFEVFDAAVGPFSLTDCNAGALIVLPDGCGRREVQPAFRSCELGKRNTNNLSVSPRQAKHPLPSSDDWASSDQLGCGLNEFSKVKLIRNKQAESGAPIQLAPYNYIGRGQDSLLRRKRLAWLDHA